MLFKNMVGGVRSQQTVSSAEHWNPNWEWPSGCLLSG